MIYDHIDNCAQYKGLHPHLDLAFSYLESRQYEQENLGSYELAGRDVYYFLQENILQKEQTNQFEYHRRYADIHFVIEGKEHVGYGCRLVGEDVDFDQAADLGFVISEKWLDCLLDGAYFALFLPGEVHQPNGWAGEGDTVRKCVLKVLLDD